MHTDSAFQMKRLLLLYIERSENKEPTSVQMQAISSFLLRRDVLIPAPSGSGKASAFTIPILGNLAAGSATSSGTRSIHASSKQGARVTPSQIVLALTRDLVLQICVAFTCPVAGKKLYITLLYKANAATIASQATSMLCVWATTCYERRNLLSCGHQQWSLPSGFLLALLSYKKLERQMNTDCTHNSQIFTHHTLD
ncbi:DEAD/DEAH box RNA helicase [Phytophthora palmivora]|uniref:ATP-dependent RNA helicase n=1 Tax=Phytophthora palmivora TaxID=4796 RepID=A0A2P4YM86_9STRA|nr:DEAD/DEAH box RNA helicase [Phytophthora palmivora]